MTEKELFKAAAALDMPDFDEVRRFCLEQKSAKRPFRYKRYIAAAACLALILIAMPVMGSLGGNVSRSTSDTASYSGTGEAAEDAQSKDADTKMMTESTDSGENENDGSAGDAYTGSDVTGRAQTTGGDTAADAAGSADSGNSPTAALTAPNSVAPEEVAPDAVAPNSIASDSVTSTYDFTEISSAPTQSYIALKLNDFTAMTADAMAEYFGVPLLPASAPEGYTETTDDSSFGVFRREGGEVYFDSVTRSYVSGDSEFDFTTAKQTMFVLPEGDAADIDGYSVKLFTWESPEGDDSATGCFGAYYKADDVQYSITGIDVTEEEFVNVMLAQLGG
ncbi:MAG: hypothetical protein VB112_08785 [Oscillospiraceae bacterium]|nr:hypothetical protein [Oscillospiraceae bacterium]